MTEQMRSASLPSPASRTDDRYVFIFTHGDVLTHHEHWDFLKDCAHNAINEYVHGSPLDDDTLHAVVSKETESNGECIEDYPEELFIENVSALKTAFDLPENQHWQNHLISNLGRYNEIVPLFIADHLTLYAAET